MALPDSSPVRLVLTESSTDRGRAAPWIGPLLALGARAARFSKRVNGRQLIIAVSVPKRDFAAALVGCGWVLASDAPALADPLATLRTLEPGAPIRAVNSRNIITGSFSSLNETLQPPRAQFAGSTWQVDGIRALAPLTEPVQPMRASRPEPGSIEHMAGLDSAWDARLALPAADLAIVGTLTWLKEDFEGYLAKEGDTHPPTSIRSLLMPNIGQVATWFTRLFASARFAEHLPLPPELKAVILDNNGAIKYLTEVETPVVICIFDRSVADETAAELVIQMRNTRGNVVTMNDLGWHPPTGVEALAFTVAL